jgi:hypothetical protein
MSAYQPERPWEQPKPDAAEELTPSGRGLRFVLIAVAVLLVLYGVSRCGTSGGSEPSAYEAKSACKEFVQRRLKSPSTADFNMDATGSGDQWTVTGTVDSQNSFGGTVRNTFSCEVRYSGTDWVLEHLSGLTN